MNYTHVFKTNADRFASVKQGTNIEIIRFPKKMPQEDDNIVTECEGEQKHTVVESVTKHEGLKSNYYLVQHKMQ